MANLVRGKAECHISIDAECRVLYFVYSTCQENDLSIIYKEFPLHSLASIKHTKFANFVNKLHQN